MRLYRDYVDVTKPILINVRLNKVIIGRREVKEHTRWAAVKALMDILEEIKDLLEREDETLEVEFMAPTYRHDLWNKPIFGFCFEFNTTRGGAISEFVKHYDLIETYLQTVKEKQND